MIEVVGVPAGGVAELPAALGQLVAEAAVLVSSPRLLASVPAHIGAERVEWPRPLVAGLDDLLTRLSRGPQPVVVLATGDPLDHGIGATLLRKLGADAVRVHPAVGSVALARARMGWSAQATEVLSLVNTDVSAVRRLLTPHRRLLLLSADESTPGAVAAELAEAGWEAARLTVLGNLGADDESRQEFVAGDATTPVEQARSAGSRSQAGASGFDTDRKRPGSTDAEVTSGFDQPTTPVEQHARSAGSRNPVGTRGFDTDRKRPGSTDAEDTSGFNQPTTPVEQHARSADSRNPVGTRGFDTDRKRPGSTDAEVTSGFDTDRKRPGSTDDQVQSGSSEIFPRLNIVAVELADGPTVGTSPGRPDDTFDNDGQLTKREHRAIALAALRPAPGQLLWDLGAGAGSIGIEWALHDPRCRVIAVERDPVRADRIEQNARTAGVTGLRVVRAGVADAVVDLPTPDAVFLGGGINGEVIDRAWAALRPGGRIVAHTVTIDTEQLILAAAAHYGGELRRINIERAEPLGSYLAWRPARPVVQWSAVRPHEENT